MAYQNDFSAGMFGMPSTLGGGGYGYRQPGFYQQAPQISNGMSGAGYGSPFGMQGRYGGMPQGNPFSGAGGGGMGRFGFGGMGGRFGGMGGGMGGNPFSGGNFGRQTTSPVGDMYLGGGNLRGQQSPPGDDMRTGGNMYRPPSFSVGPQDRGGVGQMPIASSSASMGQNALSSLNGFGFDPSGLNPQTLQSFQQAMGRMGGGNPNAGGAAAQGQAVGAPAGAGFGPAPMANSAEQMSVAQGMYGSKMDPYGYGIMGGGIGPNGTPLTAVDTLSRPQLGTPQTREASEAVMRQLQQQFPDDWVQRWRKVLDDQAVPLNSVGGGGEIAPINLNRRLY